MCPEIRSGEPAMPFEVEMSSRNNSAKEQRQRHDAKNGGLKTQRFELRLDSTHAELKTGEQPRCALSLCLSIFLGGLSKPDVDRSPCKVANAESQQLVPSSVPYETSLRVPSPAAAAARLGPRPDQGCTG